MTHENANKNLIIASAEGDLNRLERAIRDGASVNFRDAEGNTPLIVASCFGKDTCVETLLEKGANIKEKDGNGRNAFMWAVLGMNKKAAALLMLAGSTKDDLENKCTLQYDSIIDDVLKTMEIIKAEREQSQKKAELKKIEDKNAKSDLRQNLKSRSRRL